MFLLQTDNVPKYVTALAISPNGDVITGDSNGRIIVWSQDQSEAYVINHKSSEHLRHAHTVMNAYLFYQYYCIFHENS